MTEEVGKDVGNSLGRYIETDKRSWLPKQAKFMRVRVDLPIDKPLWRGGNIVNLDGDKVWISFKYERLPNFCFHCGILGHDQKHCPSLPSDSELPNQYGEWLKANASSKIGPDKPRPSNSSDFDKRNNQGRSERWMSNHSNPSDQGTDQRVMSSTPNGSQTLRDTTSGKTDGIEGAGSQVVGLDSSRSRDSTRLASMHSRDQNLVYGSGLGPLDESSSLGLQKHPTQETHKMTSPLKPTKPPPSQPDESIAQKERKLKKDRVKGQQAQGPELKVLENISGSKRIGNLDFSDEEEQGKAKKKFCDTQHEGIDCTLSLLAVAARQHRREQ